MYESFKSKDATQQPGHSNRKGAHNETWDVGIAGRGVSAPSHKAVYLVPPCYSFHLFPLALLCTTAVVTSFLNIFTLSWCFSETPPPSSPPRSPPRRRIIFRVSFLPPRFLPAVSFSFSCQAFMNLAAPFTAPFALTVLHYSRLRLQFQTSSRLPLVEINVGGSKNSFEIIPPTILSQCTRYKFSNIHRFGSRRPSCRLAKPSPRIEVVAEVGQCRLHIHWLPA